MSLRIKALDGLRGFAALSVFLSHSGFEAEKVFPLPIANLFYRLFQVGPNSVQILFVLCGFFMALLYANIDSAWKFLRKRYTRIFPVFIVVCLFLTLVQAFGINFYLQIPLLIIIALAYSTGWKLYRKYTFLNKIGWYLFGVFLSLQFLLVFISSLFSSRLFLKSFIDHLYLFLSNITLTTSFAKYYSNLSSVFWSLLPEVIFYLLFPIAVVPIIKLSKRNSIWINILIIIAFIKIIFDLDKAALANHTLLDFYFSRGVGFVVGVVVGTLYKNRGLLWNKIKIIFENKYIGILVLVALLAVQWADNLFSNSSNYHTINLYYLISSVVIGIVIIAAIIPNNIVSNIFSNKILTYIGMVSYSFYLTHLSCVEIVAKIIDPYITYIKSSAWVEIISLIIPTTISLSVATILYWSVEYLYFAGKNNNLIKAVSLKKVLINRRWQIARPIFISFFLILLISIIYLGSFTPTLQVVNHINNPLSINGFKPNKLLADNIKMPFRASKPNLATITVQMYYGGDAYLTAHQNEKTPAILTFGVLDENKKMLFESQRSAFNIEGEPYFPFGFPIINDSKNKKYNVELELIGGSNNDQVFLDPNPIKLVSGYTISRNELLHKPYLFFINRFIFVVTNPNALFAIVFIVIITVTLLKRENMYRKI